MNVYRHEHKKLVAAGADPRRFDPKGGTPTGETPTIAPKSFPFGFFAGVMFSLVLSAFLALFLDLRPAREADVRLAAIVRSALPDPEALAADDLIARLALPPGMRALLAPLFEDPDAGLPAQDWIAALTGREPLRVDPGRMIALKLLADHLATLTAAERIEELDRTLELSRALADPDVARLLSGIVTLPRGIVSDIVQSGNFVTAIEAIGRLNEDQRWTIVKANLAENPSKLQLLADFSDMNADITAIILRFLAVDHRRRPPLIYFLDQILEGDQSLERVLAAFAMHNSEVLKIASTIPKECSFAEVRACK